MQKRAISLSLFFAKCSTKCSTFFGLWYVLISICG
nr:MAG TPA: hypothetical protein [Caudoviricetes sp.]